MPIACISELAKMAVGRSAEASSLRPTAYPPSRLNGPRTMGPSGSPAAASACSQPSSRRS